MIPEKAVGIVRSNSPHTRLAMRVCMIASSFSEMEYDWHVFCSKIEQHALIGDAAIFLAQVRGELEMVRSYRSLLNQDDFWDTYAVDTVDRSPIGWRSRSVLPEATLPPSSHSDRRYHPRREVACRVDYVDSGRATGLGLITNLSMDGLFMEHVPGLKVGDRVTVAFRLPGSPPFKLKGKVKWLDIRGVGLKFDGLSSRLAGFAAGHEIESISLYHSWLCQN